MKARSYLAAAGIAGALALGAAAPVFAQGPSGCTPLCAVSCIKPISIPDRWDDVTGIVGYMGGNKRPNWRNNGSFDEEGYTDQNGNNLWDEGEPFVDGNGNGLYDAEAYDPLSTGFIADPNPSNLFAPAGDAGLVLTLHPASPGDAPAPGQYFTIDLPAINRGTPIPGSSEYWDNFHNCNPSLVGAGDRCQLEAGGLLGPTNQDMRDLISEDAGAFWDATAGQVAGSAFAPGMSPRIIRFPVHDPRIAIASGRTLEIKVTKVVAFFMEQMPGSATVQGRFLRAPGEGEVCPGGTANAGFVVACATPATPMTWGRVKGIYR